MLSIYSVNCNFHQHKTKRWQRYGIFIKESAQYHPTHHPTKRYYVPPLLHQEKEPDQRPHKPYSPWQQAPEGDIKHLKIECSRKIIKTTTSKPLWYDCIELESQIRSHTALDIYGLEGQVPETILSGQTGDISNLCEFEHLLTTLD